VYNEVHFSLGFKMLLSKTEVEKLWQAFSVFDTDNSGAISAIELGQVLKSLGQSLSSTELRDLIKEVDIDRSGSIEFDEFKTLMIAKQGDRQSRLELAFSIFDKDHSGHITADEMQSVMSQFGLTDVELNALVKEVDEDGDGSIGFAEFCQIMPPEAKATEPLTPSSSTAQTVSEDTNSAVAASPNLSKIEPDHNLSLLPLPDTIAKKSATEKMRGTSRFQMQIGMFRLIQGAAYRCFRESFSANHETHLQVKSLPYRISDFVLFVQTAIAIYKELDIVEAACHPLLDAVVQSITTEYTRLETRISNWPNLNKTPEMLAEAEAMLAARSKSANAREKFAAGVEFAITMKKQRLQVGDIIEGVLALNELNRLRRQEIEQEFAPALDSSGADPQAYLHQWHRVILTNSLEAIDGAMMPVAYWYEDFMPKLLMAFSVSTAADLPHNTIPAEAKLNEWYELTKASGEFNRYGEDVATHFMHITLPQKLAIQQAWRLTHHYLNGVQKRRERLDFGRESGALSQYVAFVDVYLGRNDIKDSQMRVSFPYYLGPAVWRFFHTTAEIIDTKSIDQQSALTNAFKDFFKLFASLYPCPYCRHHLNAYVVQNKEVDMYPVEYLLLGQDAGGGDFSMSIDDKLSTVVDGATLRLFFWKLHNTVSASIARSEEWYHQDEQAFYTTRHWPSLDSELARANALQQVSIATDRLYRIYGLLRPVSRLAGIRLELQQLLDKGNVESLKQACKIAQDHINRLESSIIAGKFLQETYFFDPNTVDQAPAFTRAEEEFGRSGLFVEI
jgi:Ca2+-binding EF-hand superfamily protein